MKTIMEEKSQPIQNKADNEKIREQREMVLKFIGEFKEEKAGKPSAGAGKKAAEAAIKKAEARQTERKAPAEKMDFVKQLDIDTKAQPAMEKNFPGLKKDRNVVENFFKKLAAESRPSEPKPTIKAKKVEPKIEPGPAANEEPRPAAKERAAVAAKKNGRKKLSDLNKIRQVAEENKRNAEIRSAETIEAAKSAAEAEKQKAEKQQGLRRRGGVRQSIDLIPIRKAESAEKPKKASIGASFGKAVLFFSLMGTVILLFYLLFSLFIYNSRIDNIYTRTINVYFPVPAVVSREIIIDYFRYKDISNEILAAMPEAKREEIEKIMLNRLMGDRSLEVKAYSFIK